MTTGRRARTGKGKVATTIQTPSEVRGQQAHRDLEIAQRRVGGTPEQRARWLTTEFLPTDPRELSTPEHIAREHQAMAFVMLGMSDPDSTLSQASLTGGSGGTFGDEHLREVWLEVRDLVIRWDGGEEVPIPAITTKVRRRPDTGKDLRGQVVREGAGRAAFIVAVFDLLCHPKVRIRRCERCKEFFVPTRRQERHPACARAHHDQEWNAKRKEKSEAKEGSKP